MMNIAVVGYNGFIGSYVSRQLARKHNVIPIGRDLINRPASELSEALSTADVVINFAGYPMLCRWTRINRERIYQSRVNLTHTLVACMNASRTRKFISVSAIGIYSDKGFHSENLNTGGQGFAANLCFDWEKAALCRNHQIPTTILRLGVVLGNGGALNKMLPLFRYGLGAVIGNGRQCLSWIHIEDLTAVIGHVLDSQNSDGIYNAVSPYPVSNREFSLLVGSLLHRPVLFRIPAFAMQILYGRGASILTGGQYVQPLRLLRENFRFQYPDAGSALGHLIGYAGKP